MNRESLARRDRNAKAARTSELMEMVHEPLRTQLLDALIEERMAGLVLEQAMLKDAMALMEDYFTGDQNHA